MFVIFQCFCCTFGPTFVAVKLEEIRLPKRISDYIREGSISETGSTDLLELRHGESGTLQSVDAAEFDMPVIPPQHSCTSLCHWAEKLDNEFWVPQADTQIGCA